MKLYIPIILIFLISCKSDQSNNGEQKPLKKDNFKLTRFNVLMNGLESKYDSTKNVSDIWSKYSYPILFHRDKALIEYSEEFNVDEKRHVTVVLINNDSLNLICYYLKMEFFNCDKIFRDPKHITFPSPIDGKSQCITDNFIGHFKLTRREMANLEKVIKNNADKFSELNYDYKKDYSISCTYYSENKIIKFSSNNQDARDEFEPIKVIRKIVEVE